MNLITESISLKSKITAIFILTLLSSVIYFNSLQGAFQFDDRNLLSKEWIADLESFKKNVNMGSFQNRPILLWTFALNNHLDPLHAFGFHLVNLILHVFVTILIFIIIIRIQNILLSNTPSTNNLNDKTLGKHVNGLIIFPFTVALIFAMHPINTDSITYISSRSSLMATFFYLLTLYFFSELLIPFRSLSQRILLGLLTISGIYLAIASKLIAVTLPVIMMIWFLVFFSPRYFPDLRERLFAPKMLIIYAFSSFILITLCHFFEVLYLPRDQGLELFGRIPYFLIQIKVIVFYYLKQFLLPFNLNVDIGFPFTNFLKDWKIIFSIIIILGVVFLVYKWGNLWVKFGATWYFVTLVPTSTIIPLNDLAVEHRMYLPMSLGLCLIAGSLLSYFHRVNRIQLYIFILFVCGLLTANRNEIWISEIGLWSDSAVKNPNSSRVHNNLGKAFFEAGNLDLARIHLEKSVTNIPRHMKSQYNIENPENLFMKIVGKKGGAQDSFIMGKDKQQLKTDFAEPHYNLASVYLDLGQLNDAETEYKKALILKPNYYSAELGIGSVKNMKGQYDLAINHFLNSIILMRKVTGKSDYALARLNLGEIYGKTERYDQAIVELKRAIKIEPSMIEAHFNLGTAYMLIGLNDKAELSFKNCLNIDPNYEPALFNIARVYQNQSLWEKSNNAFKNFLKIKGPNLATYSAMGWNSIMSGEIKQASVFYEKVLNLNPNNQVALINLAKIYYRLGKDEISRSYAERALKLDLSQTEINDLSKLLRKLSTL